MKYFFLNKKKTILCDYHLKSKLNLLIKKIMSLSVRYNELFIDLMNQLSSLMMKQGEPFRSRAYQKAQETIMTFPDDIISAEVLKGKPGIGETIFEKLNEFVKTGTLKVLEKEKNNPINIFTEIHGIGPVSAKELVDKGIQDINSLKKILIY